MVIAVFASVATEACVRVLFWVVLILLLLMDLNRFLFIMLLVMVGLVWWLDSYFNSYWSFLDNWEMHLLFMNDWTVDGYMNRVRNWLLNDIRNLSNNFNWMRDWYFHWNMNLLFNMDWVWSVKQEFWL